MQILPHFQIYSLLIKKRTSLSIFIRKVRNVFSVGQCILLYFEYSIFDEMKILNESIRDKNVYGIIIVI